MGNQNSLNNSDWQEKVNPNSSPSKEKLKGLMQLLKESWKIYCLKIKISLGILGIPIGFSFFFWILIYFLNITPFKYSFWFSILNAFFYLGSSFLWLWAIPSLIYNFRENTRLKESYRKSFEILGSYIWTYLLFAVIVAGGFLLFVIPGILFFIWFSLAFFVLIFEEKKGFESLSRSKQLIKGNFWGVLLRFLFLNLIAGIGSFLILLLISLGIENGQMINGLLGYFLQLFILPFFLIYGFLIYKNLKEIKPLDSYKKATKIEKIKYVLPGILGALIIGLIVIALFLNIFLGRDEPPFEDSDLQLSRKDIPKEENAFYDLSPYYMNSDLNQELKELIVTEYWPEGKERIEKEKEVYWPSEKSELIGSIIEGGSWDEDFVKELLGKNKKVFDDFERAIKRPFFQDPIYQDPESVWAGTPIISNREIINIAKLNLVKSAYLFEQEKEKEAFDQAFKVIEMGHMIESSQGQLMHFIYGVAIKELGLERLRNMIPGTNLSSESLLSYIDEINKFKENEKTLANSIKMEYMSSINTKSMMFDDFNNTTLSLGPLEKTALRLNYFYKPNQTTRIFAEQFQEHYLENINKDYSEIEELKFETLAPSSSIKMLFTENLMGKMFHDIAFPTFNPFLLKSKEGFSIIGTQLLMAIKSYQIETGRIPGSLNELVPKYLLEVPKDPFDGKPIRYLPEKKIIYSVGWNLEDLSNVEEENWQEMESLIFEIEF